MKVLSIEIFDYILIWINKYLVDKFYFCIIRSYDIKNKIIKLRWFRICKICD